MSSTADLDGVDGPLMRRVLVAATLGNFVEWFDFAVYGFMATAIAHHFFPSNNPTTGLLQTFAVFAVAFALRPLGAVVFGVLGDRVGRKRVLSLTVLLIGGSTTLIGVLPSYQSIGIAATVLLCLARAVQGFSAGGEYAGACTYVVEHASTGRRARHSSWLPAGTFFAFAAAAAVSYGISAVLTPAAVDAWGWRLPFLVAAPVGLLGFYIRHRLSETPAFQRLEETGSAERSPLRRTLRTQGRMMLLLGGVVSASGLSFYTLTTYMSTYVQVVAHRPAAAALLISVVALIVSAALSPLAGRLSDRVGRRPTTLTACALITLVSVPAFALAGSTSSVLSILGQCLLALGVVSSLVAVAVLMAELFPTTVRYTAAALTYNVAYTIFGGTAPFVATFLVARTHNSLSPAYYLTVVGLGSLLCALAIPESAGRSLESHVDDAGTSPGPDRPVTAALSPRSSDQGAST